MPPRDPFLLGLGEALRAQREQQEVSQEGLYLETGVHRNYIGGIERGERKPRVETVIKLAIALDIAPSRLFAKAEHNAKRRDASWPSAGRRNGPPI